MTMLTADEVTVGQVAKMIDHSLLCPELTVADVRAGCALAVRYRIASVCVKPCGVPFAVSELARTDVLVGTVVGFPHGGSATRVKVAEARMALGRTAPASWTWW